MKLSNSIFLLCVAAALPLSCTKQLGEEPTRNPAPEEGIVLTLSSSRLSIETKTPNPPHGEDERNENDFGSKVDVFFFTDSTATAPIRKRKIQADVYNGRVTIPTTLLEVKTIFGSTVGNSPCYVLVVANYDGSYDGCQTWGDIDALLLPIARWSTGNPEKFVMTGAQKLLLKSATAVTPASGNVDLNRIAVKVSFELTVTDTAESEGSTDNLWEPITTGMTVYMVYAMREAALSGAPRRLPLLSINEKPVNYTNDLTDDTHLLYEYRALSLIDSGRKVARTRDGSTRQVPLYITATKDNNDQILDQEIPFYTYPSQWDPGASNEPYLKLIIPWNNGRRTKYYYYKIPFFGTTMERNNWYKISIDVQALGGEEPVPPPITVKYAIADWSGERDQTEAETGDQSVIPATIIASRYLTIPTKEYIMYNTDEVTIPITSSHNVEVIGFTVKNGAFTATETSNDANYVGQSPRIYNPFTTTLLGSTGSLRAAHPDYSESTVQVITSNFTSATPPSSPLPANNYNWYVRADGRDKVIITHQLNRDMSNANYDVAPWTLRLRIRHETDSEGNENKYYEDITIEQRPAIIIRPEPNTDQSTNGTAHYGYAFVNGAQNNGTNLTNNNGCADGTWTASSATYSSGWFATRTYYLSDEWDYYLGSAPSGLANSNNKAASMYVIETSVLPTNGNIASYMLGDPRSSEIDNLGQSWSQSRTSWHGSSPRRITYYYPASTDPAYNNFIAPKLRIASSFGATMPVYFQDAQRRCASYQEDGYPAGRWRLPTKAEIEYIAQLNSDNKIELLLGSDTGTSKYWCNSGYMTVELNETPIYTASTANPSGHDIYVRCVYDDWYWGASSKARLADTNLGTFTWGDIPRNAVTSSE